MSIPGHGDCPILLDAARASFADLLAYKLKFRQKKPLAAKSLKRIQYPPKCTSTFLQLFKVMMTVID